TPATPTASAAMAPVRSALRSASTKPTRTCQLASRPPGFRSFLSIPPSSPAPCRAHLTARPAEASSQYRCRSTTARNPPWSGFPPTATAANGTSPLRDRDTYVLECLPRTTPCPTTSTTTTTSSTTTTLPSCGQHDVTGSINCVCPPGCSAASCGLSQDICQSG